VRLGVAYIYNVWLRAPYRCTRRAHRPGFRRAPIATEVRPTVRPPRPKPHLAPGRPSATQGHARQCKATQGKAGQGVVP
jgi:hypothetical protein